jgi:hypothetical protein
MKVIYIAGAYRNDNSMGVITNIYLATQAAYKLWTEGWAVICPHMNTAHFHDLPQELIIPGDLEILKRCDAIYLLKGWQSSQGATTEHNIAKELGLEIFYEE